LKVRRNKIDIDYQSPYQPNEVFKRPYTEEIIEVAKLTWLKELENGVKLYFKIRGVTYSLEWDDQPDDLIKFSIEFKKNF
jgi:hypothetical protein